MTSVYRKFHGSRFHNFNSAIKTFNGQSSMTITNDYFDIVSIIYGGILKRWNGTSWVKAKLKTFNGSIFVNKPLNIFKAGTFQLVDTTGV